MSNTTNTPTPIKKASYLIIYHAHCLDGITAAAVTHRYLTEKLSVDAKDIHHWPANYNDDLFPLITMIEAFSISNIYIVDFSYKKEDLYLIGGTKGVDKINIFDHHASAFRNLCTSHYKVEKDSREAFFLSMPYAEGAYVRVLLDNDESGASLVWKELFPGTGIPYLVKYVKDYDLYRFEFNETKAVNKYLKTYDKTVDNFLSLLEQFKSDTVRSVYVSKGEAILSYENSLEDELISGGLTSITINGITGLAVNAPLTLGSSIGNKLAEQFGTFGAVWCQLSDGVVKFSLRSIGDSCDVGMLAEAMGGGGHKTASGFVMDSPNFSKEDGITLWRGVDLAAEEDEPVKEEVLAVDVAAELKHNWVCIDKVSNLYDSIYECTVCKKQHTESIDNLDSSCPELGCAGYNEQEDVNVPVSSEAMGLEGEEETHA